MRYSVYCIESGGWRVAATLEELFEAIGGLAEDGPLQSTSLRLHEALAIATELGMSSSVSAATREALADRIRDFDDAHRNSPVLLTQIPQVNLPVELSASPR
jgi:hypothetical protein